jgi:hypothetical protein
VIGRREAGAPRRRRIGCLPLLLIVAVVVVIALVVVMRPKPLPTSQPLPSQTSALKLEHLRPVWDFAAISDPDARSVAPFTQAGRVSRITPA